MPCFRCGRRQTDPAKGKSPWARVVRSGIQVLVCPQCQAEDPSLVRDADRCPHCGASRLVRMMGLVVCRACGRDWEG